MPCSEKKRQANRNNAQKSTGPKSKLGKEKVALNALKHGLRSAQVVLPGEDAAAFDGMVAAWMDDWKPPTDARRVLVEHAVAHAWRLRRCLKLERDHLVERGQQAVDAHRRDAANRARAEVARLGQDPAAALDVLLRDREGVRAVIGLWRELARAAESPGTWDDMEAHHVRLINLLGEPASTEAEPLGGPVYGSWRLIEWNEPEPTDYADDCPADLDEAESLAGELAAFIAGQIRDLEHYAATRLEPPEALAARTAQQAALDDSPEGRALLRYEGQHGREFRATLNQLIKLTQTGADLVEDEEAVSEAQDVVPEPVESPEPAAPNKATEGSEMASEVPSEPSEPPADDAVGRAFAAFRARNGLPEPVTRRLNQ
jgi:hypothetical protein